MLRARCRILSSTALAARRFEGMTAVVTGAGRDIGGATARRLAAEGAKVVLHYHASAEGAEASAAAVREAGGEAKGARNNYALALIIFNQTSRECVCQPWRQRHEIRVPVAYTGVALAHAYLKPYALYDS